MSEELIENNNSFTFRLIVADLSQRDLEVETDEHTLIIYGSTAIFRPCEYDDKCIVEERTGTFSRSVNLPCEVSDANFYVENETLIVTLPKKTPQNLTGKKIPLEG